MPSSSWRVDPRAVDSATAGARAGATQLSTAQRALLRAVDAATDALGPTASARALTALRDGLFAREVRSTVATIDDAANRVDTAVAMFDEGDATMSAQISQAQGGAGGGRRRQ